MRELLGKNLIGYKVSSDGREIEISTTSSQNLCYRVYGDCCSESWIEEVIGVEPFAGEVLSLREIPMKELPDYPESGRQEYDTTYGYEIITDKGTTKLIFRNSSNGYYGGWLYFAGPRKPRN